LKYILRKVLTLLIFKDYDFADKLGKLTGTLKIKRGPKVDIIIAYEDKKSPFLLCAEVKYFHSAAEHYQKTPIKTIGDDIEKLKAIRDCGIAKKVVFILFDDYYWFTDEKIEEDIKNEVNRIKEEKKIEVLFYNSKAKLKKYENK